MEFIVNKDEIILKEDSKVHKGEYNATEFNFIFSEEYNDLIKKAIFENKTESIEVSIVNNKCNIPSVMIESTENRFNLRVYGYVEENGNLIIRYSPAYITIPIYPGSYKGGAIPIPTIQESKDVSYTENGEYEVIADEGYDGIAKTNISIDVQPSLETKSETITENGDYTYTPSTDYYGMSEVGINVNVQPSLETKNVSITQNGSSTVQTSQEYYGMNEVKIDVNIPLEQKSETITTNGSYTYTAGTGYEGLSQVGVSVNVSPNLQDKSVTITENTTTTISKDSSYDGLGTVTITTNVPNTGLDFTEIGYASTPTFINNAMNYAKQVQQNWTVKASYNGEFKGDKNLIYFPVVDTSSATNMYEMFMGSDVETVPLINTSNVTNFQSMFQNSKIRDLAEIDLSNATTIDSMFNNCALLRTLPNLNCTKATYLQSVFANSKDIITIGEINCPSALYISSLFGNYYDTYSLVNFGGFKDIGKNVPDNWIIYGSILTLDLRSLKKLSHQSVMNIINKLYDMKSRGFTKDFKLILYTNIYNNLTAEEIAIATNKGWAISTS